MKLDIFDYIFFLAVHNADKPYQEILLYRLFERQKCFEYGEMELKNVTNNCVNLAVEPTGEY